MLQSPLTRKSAGSGCRDDARNELFKNKTRSSVDNSSYQISSASPVSSLSDKLQGSLNELNGHEETLQRSRDFPIKTTPMCDTYDRRTQNYGSPVREVQAPYVNNNGEESSIFIKHLFLSFARADPGHHFGREIQNFFELFFLLVHLKIWYKMSGFQFLLHFRRGNFPHSPSGSPLVFLCVD